MVNYFIYCLNLKRQEKRKNIMISQFSKLNLKYKICDAIDYKKISIKNEILDINSEYRKGEFKIDENNIEFQIKSLKYFQYVKSNGHVGCVLSHLYYIKDAYLNNYNNLIILEDDISFDYIFKWNKTIDEIVQNAPKDWTILKLHCSNNKILKKYFDSERYVKIPYKSTAFWSTGFYIINRNGMEEILKKYFNNSLNEIKIFEEYPVADYILYLISGVYYYSIPLVKNNNIDFNIKSDIANRHMNIIERQGIELVEKYYLNKKSNNLNKLLIN